MEIKITSGMFGGGDIYRHPHRRLSHRECGMCLLNEKKNRHQSVEQERKKERHKGVFTEPGNKSSEGMLSADCNAAPTLCTGLTFLSENDCSIRELCEEW